MQAVILVGLGGAIGAMARYGAGVLFGWMGLIGFPWATLVVNVSGSFAMGLLIGYLAHTTPSNQSELQLLLAVGVLGGFTTFSSFSLDAVALIERGQLGLAAGYILVSVLVAIGALFGGLMVMRGLLT
jgi:CrcB protein